MDEHFDGKGPEQSEEIVTIHPHVKDVKGSGKTDEQTGRYIPVGGGSRTRVPIRDDKRISRYAGNLGVDASLSGKIDSMAALYARLGAKTKQALGADFPAAIGRPDLAESALAEGEEEPLEFMTEADFEAPASNPPAEATVPEAEPVEAEEAAPRRRFSFKPLEDDLEI